MSDKELLADRHLIFKDVGIPAVEQRGFSKSPFSSAWYGQYDRSIKGYLYDLCRLTNGNQLEWISVIIVSGDRWIKIFLNIFQLDPAPDSISQLQGYDGLMYKLPPNSLGEMRLRNDDYKGPPLFYMLFLPEHKVARYFTKYGYRRSLNKLSKLMAKDMDNIDSFVKRWHELYTPALVDWKAT